MSIRKQLSDKVLIAEHTFYKAREEYGKLALELREFDAAEREKNKTPEQRAAEAQTGKCGCICGCDDKVKGELYMGQVKFWNCSDCTMMCS